MRALASIFALVVPMLSLEAAAIADDAFDAIASKAIAIDSTEALESLLWSQDANCDKSKNELVRRQCEGVVRAAKNIANKRNYFMGASQSSIQAQVASDKKSIELSLGSCVLCENVDYLVLGQGDYKRATGQVVPPELAKATKSFPSAKEAEAWNKAVGQKLRAQMVFSLPISDTHFRDGELSGYKVNIVGYRLYDPCKGGVLLSKPESKQGPIDKEACAAEPVKKTLLTKKAPLVERLSAKQIKAAMKPAREEAKACHTIYNIQGRAQFKIVIGGDGSMKEAVQRGDFEGTPTGMCLDRAMAKVRFPKSKKKETAITYPLLLR